MDFSAASAVEAFAGISGKAPCLGGVFIAPLSFGGEIMR
jgi:hypothetical protein